MLLLVLFARDGDDGDDGDDGAMAKAMARVARTIANIPQQRSAQGMNTFSIASPTVSRQAVGVPAATMRRRRARRRDFDRLARVEPRRAHHREHSMAAKRTRTEHALHRFSDRAATGRRRPRGDVAASSSASTRFDRLAIRPTDRPLTA
mmetsp:Transcript_6150/g.24456  ORF Transcript_6150/g.24456 Transcript_6150/m.24456 type:complete len:149 (-) Transcript_6150:1593-2039(-)